VRVPDLTRRTTGSANEEYLTTWLDAFLANATGTPNTSITSMNWKKNLREIVANDDKSDQMLEEKVDELSINRPSAALEVESKWLRHTHSLKGTSAFESTRASEEYQKVSHLIEKYDVKECFDIIKMKISTQSEETWNDFYETMTQVGLELIAYDAEESERRNRFIPVLCFDESKSANKLTKMLSYPIVSLHNEIDLFRKLLKKISIDDESNYTARISIASLFLLKGYTQVSIKLAKNAIAKADSQQRDSASDSCSRPIVSGREACYFLASLYRSRAQSLDDLDIAKQYLEEAKIRLARNMNEKNVNMTGNRFRAESISITTSELYFKSYYKKYNEKDLNRTLSLRVEILDEIVKLSTIRSQYIYNWVERTLLSNYFSVYSILSLNGKGHFWDDNVKELQKYAARYSSNLIRTFGEGQKQFDFLPWNVFILATFSLSKYGSNKNSPKGILNDNIELIEKCLENSDKNVSTYPFDHFRFKWMIREARKHLAKR